MGYDFLSLLSVSCVGYEVLSVNIPLYSLSSFFMMDSALTMHNSMPLPMMTLDRLTTRVADSKTNVTFCNC